MDVTLCFITCDMHERVRSCWESLLEYSEGHEIVVCHSDCNPEYIIANDQVRILSTPSLCSIPAARNLCLSVATGDIIIWMDDDIMPLEPFVSSFIALFIADDKVGVAGYDGCVVNESFEKDNERHSHWYVDPMRSHVDYFYSPYAIRKQMINEIGNYDENLSMCDGDNTELCIRAMINGWKLQGIEPIDMLHWKESTRLTLYETGVAERKRTKEVLKEKFPVGWRAQHNIPTPEVPVSELQGYFGRKIDTRFLSPAVKALVAQLWSHQ